MIGSRMAMSMWLAALATMAVALTAWLTGALAAGPTHTVNWTTVAVPTLGTFEGSGIEAGGKFYAFGGYDVTKPGYTPTERSYVYDPGANTWTRLADLPAFNGPVHPGITHAGIATDGASIYLAGGYPSDDIAGTGQTFGTQDVWRYNIAANTYTQMPDLPLARAAGGLAYVNGELHFFGGVVGSRADEKAEHWVLHPVSTGAVWVERKDLPHPRNHLGTAVIGGRIYVVGGQIGQDDGSTSEAFLEAYDPVADAWTELAPLPVPLSHTVATVLGGQLVAVGGQTSYGSTSSNAYAYNPATNAWTAMSPLPGPRFAGMLGTVGGKLLYVGGATSAGPSNTVFSGTVPDLAGGGSGAGQTAAAAGSAPGGSSSLQIGTRKSAVGSRITLSVTVSGPGSLTARPASKSKPLIGTAKSKAKTAGPLKLTIKLTSAGKKQLRKKGTLKVKAKVSFTPTGGKATSRTISLTFKAKTKS